MSPVVLSREADRDIDGILQFSIARHGQTTGEGYVHAINGVLDRLSVYPEIGNARDDLAPGLRSFPSGQHRIFYRVEPDRLLIVRVLHKAMDAALHL